MQNKIKILIGLVAVLVVAIVALGMLWSKKPPQNAAVQQGNVAVSPAPAGQIVQGFPKELILDKAASAAQSYTISYDRGNQYTAVFESTMSKADLYKAYLAYFQGKNYSIVNQSDNDPVSSIYAKSSSADYNVVISRVANSAQNNVSVTYLARK